MIFTGSKVSARVCAITALVISMSPCVAAATEQSDYTADQAAHGAQIFEQRCARCHGVSLEGLAGPPLAGPNFESTLEFGSMSASQLYEFISHAMPADAPGSLSPDDYAAVLGFILSKNGYPSGKLPLSAERLGQIQLLPYPGAASGKVSTQQ